MLEVGCLNTERLEVDGRAPFWRRAKNCREVLMQQVCFFIMGQSQAGAVFKLGNEFPLCSVARMQVKKLSVCVLLPEVSDPRSQSRDSPFERGETKALAFHLLPKLVLLKRKLPPVLRTVKLEHHFFGDE